jgi:plastocyanin
VRILAALLAGAALLLAAAVPASAARKPQHKTVKIGDNYFTPVKLTVNARSTVTWRWPGAAGDVHDVALVKAPRGVARFQSDPAASDFSFRRKLKRPGLYHFVCTFHEADGMTMTVRVRR